MGQVNLSTGVKLVLYYYQDNDYFSDGEQQQQEIVDYGDGEHQEIEDYGNEGQHQEIKDEHRHNIKKCNNE